MGHNSKSRPKKRLAKVVAKPKVKAKKPVPAPKKRKAKSVKPVQVGQPPTDMTPPHIEDTRPTPAPAPQPAQPAPKSDVPVGVTTGGPLVQGATCTWIGPMSATGTDQATHLSLCPHCSGHVITAADEETMRLGFEAWELGVYPSADLNHPPRPHPGYRGLVSWMRGQNRCWPTIERAAVAYREATGTNVDAGL